MWFKLKNSIALKIQTLVMHLFTLCSSAIHIISHHYYEPSPQPDEVNAIIIPVLQRHSTAAFPAQAAWPAVKSRTVGEK